MVSLSAPRNGKKTCHRFQCGVLPIVFVTDKYSKTKILKKLNKIDAQPSNLKVGRWFVYVFFVFFWFSVILNKQILQIWRFFMMSFFIVLVLAHFWAKVILQIWRLGVDFIDFFQYFSVLLLYCFCFTKKCVKKHHKINSQPSIVKDGFLQECMKTEKCGKHVTEKKSLCLQSTPFC